MRYLRSTLFAVIFTALTRCAGAADDSVTGTLADVVQNVGSMTMMQVRDLALEQAMEIKPIKYKSTQLETATFTGTYTPTESDRFLVMFSDDGYKITVKLGGEEVFKQDALNRGQHLPNVDGNPEQTRSLHLLPIVLEKGVTYEIEVVYRNKFYYGATDIDGITVFVVDSATEFEMCSAVCTPAGGMKPTTAVGDPHDVHIRARVDTDGRTRTYKVTFRAHNPPNGLVRVDDIEVEDLDGGLPILFFQKGTLNNHATFSVSSQVLPGAPNMLTKRLQVTVHFKGVNPGSVTLSFYDKRTERATDVGWELLRDNTAIPGDERKTWLVGTGEVAAVANAGVAVSGARAYLPRGGGTVEVVVKADLGAGVAHDAIENWPNNPDGDPWPVRVLWQSDAGTVTAVVRGRGTASTIFGAKPDFVGQATLSWVTGTSTNVATITIPRLEYVADANNDHVIDSTDGTIEFVQIGHWGADHNFGTQQNPIWGVNGYRADGTLRNNLGAHHADPNLAWDNFVDRDLRRFYLRVTDLSRNLDVNNAESLTVHIGTLLSDGSVDDDLTPMHLIETGNNTGVFVSRSQLLMSPDLPLGDNPDDRHEVHDGFNGPVADNALNDRTHRATVDGTITFEYRPAAGLTYRHDVPVFRRAPEERRVLRVRVRVFNEPPGVDISGDGVINTVLGTEQAATAHVNAQLSRANIAWAQAGIRVELEGQILFVNAPNDANGNNILADGVFSYPGDTAICVNAFAGNASADVLDVFFVAAANINATAFCLPPFFNQNNFPNLGENTFVFIFSVPVLDVALRTLAHEIGHALQNRDDAANPQHVFYPATNTHLDNNVTSYRRITESTETDCRTARQAGNLGDVGNRLLRNP